jgi:hypothetical protein
VSSRRASVLRWVARLLGVALVVYVVATQVRWSDEVSLADGSKATGTVVARAGGWRAIRRLAASATSPTPRSRTRLFGARRIPSIAFGLPTLVGRLSGSLPTVAFVLAALLARAPDGVALAVARRGPGPRVVGG